MEKLSIATRMDPKNLSILRKTILTSHQTTAEHICYFIRHLRIMHGVIEHIFELKTIEIAP